MGAGGRLRLHAPGSWLEVSGIYCPPAVLTGGQGIDGPSSGQLWGGTRTPESSAGEADAASRPLQLLPPRPASRSHCPRHFPRVRIVKNRLPRNPHFRICFWRTRPGTAGQPGLPLVEHSGKGCPFSTLTCTGPQLGPARAEVPRGDTEQ